MDFEDSLLLAIVDKLLIGVLLAIVGYWLSEALERVKGRIALQNALAPARALACSKLWALTQRLSPRGDLHPSAEDCERSFDELREWYYSESGAMYLSHKAAGLTLTLLKHLETRDAVRSKADATALRTQLKLDLGTYSHKDAATPLASAG